VVEQQIKKINIIPSFWHPFFPGLERGSLRNELMDVQFLYSGARSFSVTLKFFQKDV